MSDALLSGTLDTMKSSSLKGSLSLSLSLSLSMQSRAEQSRAERPSDCIDTEVLEPTKQTGLKYMSGVDERKEESSNS
jgi:hypothetical protein